LTDGSQSSPEDIPAMPRSFIAKGLAAIEVLIEECWSQSTVAPSKRFAVGTAQPTIADLFLIPQIYSAKRFGANLEVYPRCMEVFALAESLPAFMAAAPANQPDAKS
jgi:glutathione S-transferase